MDKKLTGADVERLANVRLCGAHMWTWTSPAGHNYYNYWTRYAAIEAAAELWVRSARAKEAL